MGLWQAFRKENVTREDVEKDIRVSQKVTECTRCEMSS